ncbi:MAG: helix-turn-helix transcriptional regulator [Clostridia bacterium]|nr:helix-turn-helix transcriptional regulator [Clostridia bacterium]
MNIIPVSKLYEYNYSVDVVNALRQFWRNGRTFSCINAPKKTNMLLYLDGVKAEYTLKDNRSIVAENGSLVYTPLGSEYTVRFFDFETERSSTVGINFFLFDKNGEDFILGDDILIFQPSDVKPLVEKIDLSSESLLPSPQVMKSGLYDIFTLLSQKKYGLDKRFVPIKKGIEYLENDVSQALSVKEIAKMCCVSEIYFRRLFKEYSSLSPTEYRMHSRMEKAKSFLKFDNLNTIEIASLLGFTDTSYFCRQFKKHTGISPTEYKRQFTTN